MHQTERAGVLAALAGFVLMSIGDVVWKFGSTEWAPTAMAALRYTMGAVGLGVILLMREGAEGFRVNRPLVQLMRGGGVAVATACFVTAIRFMPLVEVTAIAFMSPIFTALLAAVFLREPVGRETWIATFCGFVGVLIVLRPNVMVLGAVAILPLFTAFGMSLLVIGNRLSSRSGSALAMQFQVAAPAAVTLWLMAIAGHGSGLAFLVVGNPTLLAVILCAMVACIATVAHWLVYLGTTRAGAATIAPMTYVQIVVAGTLGWALFGDRPDLFATLGIAIIVGAGLYRWHAKPAVAVADEAA
ncbi:DMT family transporter [Croceicoccus ponticola]|uniref:DMT family transporter n=1 Tax=Croceicoccus ponticola TaxID=2217664 RepID=A0A437GWT7_9SPHN|nr:DMT family transporter [Croceicoccus ponticola]RVQ65484.1 DMT family transporter [Croceicoccus ponticola]